MTLVEKSGEWLGLTERPLTGFDGDFYFCSLLFFTVPNFIRKAIMIIISFFCILAAAIAIVVRHGFVESIVIPSNPYFGISLQF